MGVGEAKSVAGLLTTPCCMPQPPAHDGWFWILPPALLQSMTRLQSLAKRDKGPPSDMPRRLMEQGNTAFDTAHMLCTAALRSETLDFHADCQLCAPARAVLISRSAARTGGCTKSQLSFLQTFETPRKSSLQVPWSRPEAHLQFPLHILPLSLPRSSFSSCWLRSL